MRSTLSLLCAAAALLPATAAWAQKTDVVVMRRAIALPKKADAGTQTPTPTPTPGSDGYHWDEGQWGGFESACSASTVKRRTVTCQNQSGTVFPDSSCSFAQKPLTEIRGPNTEGCVGEWRGTGYVWDSTCSPNATEVQEVTCRSATDPNFVIEDRYCTGTKPSQYGRREARYEGCASFAWTPGEWSNWSNACATSATRTRTVTCSANDGKGNTYTVADKPYCDQAGAKPKTSETENVSTGCEKVANPTLEANGGGWQLGPGASIESNGVSSALKITSVANAGAGYASQLVDIVANKRYDWSYEIRTNMAAGTCTRSDRSPMALWFVPNPYNNYAYENQYLCGVTVRTKTGSFVATYTGQINIVFWSEPENASRPSTIFIDNVSVRQAQ
jgi:hypothetical protein